VLIQSAKAMFSIIGLGKIIINSFYLWDTNVIDYRIKCFLQ